MKRIPKYTYELENVRGKFSNLIPQYKKLGANLVQAIEMFLREKNIKILSINYRVRNIDSFLEKAKRKNYTNPLNQCEDICGVRIICYYKGDIKRICKIIEKEFNIVESQDKEELLELDQFSYRSHHFIVKIKDAWLEAPNYRRLEELKAEIQVRTLLMHAWAEIQHHLVYKKEAHIDAQFKRKLSMLSAKLEEADEQFDELRGDIHDYRVGLIEKAQKSGGVFDKGLPLNLDNLQACLDFYFPNRSKNFIANRNLLDELLSNGIQMKVLIDSIEKTKHFLPEFESDFSNTLTRQKDVKWSQASAVFYVLDLATDIYADKGWVLDEYKELIEKWRKKVRDAS